MKTGSMAAAVAQLRVFYLIGFLIVGFVAASMIAPSVASADNGAIIKFGECKIKVTNFNAKEREKTTKFLDSNQECEAGRLRKESRPTSYLRLRDRKIDANLEALVEAWLDYSREHKYVPFQLFLSSPGGDVSSAMKIGRMLSADGVFVWLNGDCLSACVLVYAGAPYRMVLDDSIRVGVHRPFETDVSALSGDGTGLAQKYAPVERAIEQYLRSFGVSRSLVDLMISTPSTRMRFLSRQEMEDFGLGSDNVAQVELEREKDTRCRGAEFVDRKIAIEETARKCAAVSSSLDEQLECSREALVIQMPMLKERYPLRNLPGCN